MIKENLEEIRRRVESACERCGRDKKEVTLIAVSKTKPLTALLDAYAGGVRDFGENKVQEILDKHPGMPADTRFHMIGHLQRNKVRQVLGKTVLIHSVDSLRLAEQIESEAARLGIRADILLEINVSAEESKYGFSLAEAEEKIRIISRMPHLHICGLMTIAPFVSNPEENRDIFKKLSNFYVDMSNENIDNVTMSVLSMGMTGDYEVAVEEGATMIRVGTGIFGTR